MTIKGLPEKLNGYVMCSGAGGSRAMETKRACVMEMVAILQGLPVRDDPPCVAADLRRLLIRINDGSFWDSDEQRTAALAPYITKVIGTADGGQGLMRRRAFVAADHAVRVFAPAALDYRGLHAHAATLRALRPIVDAETAREGSAAAAYAAAYAAAAYAAADAAAYAAAADAAAYAAAADAAAYAAAAAYASANAADAAADAYAAAAAAAYASANAADDAAAGREKARNSVLRMLDRMLAVK
jgi:hypothetical protein